MKLTAWLFLVFLVGCASPGDGPDGVLEPMEPETGAAPSPAPLSPLYTQLMEKLSALGYEGVGLTFESDATLDMLLKVFSDPAASNRQIKLVYTGLANTYDGKAQSLTVGGTSNTAAILAFIKKKIPVRPQPR